MRESDFSTLELVPPNPASNERGPTESYFLMVFGVRTSNPSDPKLVEQIEGLLKQIAPFLVPRGDTELLKRPPNAALMRWRGSSPSGVNAGANVYALPSRSLSLALVAIGEEAQIQARENNLQSIFSTFHFGSGDRDLNLAAAWDNSEDRTYMHLRKDGTFLASQSPQSSQTAPQSAPAAEQQTASGRWYAGGAKLYLVADDSGCLSFRYELKGAPGSRLLILRDATGQEQNLQESKRR